MGTEIAAETEAIGIETLVKASDEALVQPTEPTAPGSSNSIKRKRRELSLGEKVKLIQESSNSGKSHRYLAGIFNIGKTTVHDILKNKDRILNAYKNGDDSRSRKRIRLRYGNDDINKLTWHWYEHKRSQSLQVTGPNLQVKAREFAEEFDAKDFRASNGWLESFKKRYNIHFGMTETFGLNDDKPWQEIVQEATDGHRPNDIYTLQEIGLLYRALPDKTFASSVGSNMKDANESSGQRVSILLCCNMSGEFEVPVVVGKCAKSSSLESAPVTWRSNKRAWMTSIIFEKWLHDFDNKLRNEDRHVILFTSISTAHPPHPQLFNIKLVFFPNKPQPTFPDVCPLNLGIVECFRHNYRKKVLLSIINQDCDIQQTKQLFQQIDEVQACKWIASAVNDIPSNKVKKAFETAGFHTSPRSDSLSSYSMAFTALNGEESSPTTSGDLYTVYLHDCLPNSVADVSKAVDETEIQLLLNRVLAKLKIEHPMTVREFVLFDTGLQTSDDLSEGWEERLVEDFSDNHDTTPLCEDSTGCSRSVAQTPITEDVTTCKKTNSRTLVTTYLEAAQLNRHLISFAKDKHDEDLLDLLQNVESSMFSRRLVSNYQEAILINKHLISFAQEEKNEELLIQLNNVEKKLKFSEAKREESNSRSSLNT